MSTVKDSLVREKLSNLNSSQASIETLSQWMIFYKKQAPLLVSIWKDEWNKSTPDRRLTLIYLANDILQNSRKKGREFQDAFRDELEECIGRSSSSGGGGESGGISGKLVRVFDIWIQRGVFEEGFVNKLKSLLLPNGSAAAPVAALDSTSLNSTIDELYSQVKNRFNDPTALPLIEQLLQSRLNMRQKLVNQLQELDRRIKEEQEVIKGLKEFKPRKVQVISTSDDSRGGVAVPATTTTDISHLLKNIPLDPRLAVMKQSQQMEEEEEYDPFK